MSMPPSGIAGQGMDEEAIIEAEIQFELDNINLDNDPFIDNDPFVDDVGENDLDLVHGEGEGFIQEFNIPNEIDDYIRRIQDQTRKFEEELEECDDLLHKSDKPGTHANLAVIPYDDQQLLDRLAGELGCSVDDYKKRILDEIAKDEFEITDELAEFTSDDLDLSISQPKDGENTDEQLAITDGQDGIVEAEQEIKLKHEIGKAVEEGIDPSEVPVSQDLLPVNKQINGKTNAHVEIQNMLREQLGALESRYEERLDKLKKDEAFHKAEEEVREKRLDEERLWKKQEYEREEQKLKLERELAEKKIQAEQSEVEKEFQEQTKKFEREMAELQAETERQKKELERAMEDERQRQTDKQNKSAVKIQSYFRGYRDRKKSVPVLKEKREIRQKEKEEERIKIVEKEILTRNEVKKQKEEEERLKKEEEKKQKELEKQQKEDEKRRKKEEEEKRKQEEKQRKEEEKQKKKEEERKRKEEEKRRKEEEEQRKKEEKRLKEEQEKQRKEEEKRRKEDEKRQKEEEKKRKEEEKRQKEEETRQKEVEKKPIEEIESKDYVTKLDQNKDQKLSTESEISKVMQEKESNNNPKVMNENSVLQNGIDEIESGTLKTEKTTDANRQEPGSNKEKPIPGNKSEMERIKSKDATETDCKTEQNSLENKTNGNTQNTQSVTNDTKQSTENLTMQEKQLKESSHTFKHVSVLDKQDSLEKIQQSGHIPHPPSPRKRTKSSLQSKVKSEKTDTSLDMTKIDCLPDQLESLRLGFMKDCQSWSKVSNEPWKLKSGLSRKPLRRPSSAKKLPLVPDNLILHAANVASLQQVTTVQLSDLPGNNISPLGQCWGLKYLSMNNCNLVAVDSLGQCKQLQYIDVKNNRIEYLDLKDVGQLQYLNVSHNRLSSIHGIDNCSSLRWIDLSHNNITKLGNRLSSIHGIDNCSSLRWIDLSHNNITKLGGLETLRRLNTLIVSNNQLISADGLGATPTLQMIDMSHNHLQEINDLEKMCLLLSIDLSSNNLLTVPCFKNQVLLQEVNLSDNSISSLDELSVVWLPLLTTLNLSQNSLGVLSSLQNCLTLKNLDLTNNQISEFDTISQCVEGCIYLEMLLLEDNPVVADLNDSSFKSLERFCPRLQMKDLGPPKKLDPLKPRTSFETMCLTQSQAYRDTWNHFDTSLKSTKPQDLSTLCDLHHKYCEKTFNTSVEHRYAHEYGEVSVTMPTAPTTPKSGRPKSGRQKETYASPKDMFENALKVSSKPSVEVGANGDSKTVPVVASLGSNPRDLFEQALKSTESVPVNNRTENVKMSNSVLNGSPVLANGLDTGNKTAEDKRMKAIITIQAYWRGWLVRHEIAEQTKIWLAATSIQARWRGYRVRKQLNSSSHMANVYNHVPTDVLEHLNRSAVVIQAIWRGYILRKKLFAALEYAQCNFEEEEDDEAMMFGDDFDLDKFVSLDQNLLEDDWKPPDTPDIPAHHPVLKKPPSGHTRIPPIALNDLKPPNNPRKAWRNADSPISGLNQLSRPPSSVASTDLTARTGVSRKEERLTEEWGFKDTNTAHIMLQRAKKMKYNAERRNKINKLDPKQRLALYRKLEEVTQPRTVTAPQRKTLPRKEYFKARQEEIYQQDQERKEEYHVRASRTFEWLHTQVGDHVVSDSIINKGFSEGPRYMPDLPELQGNRRVQLTSAGSIELQSVESVSSAGHRPRRASAEAGSSHKLPPIQTSSAPTNHIKERMSFRKPKANQSVGWGGGKKRGSLM